MATGGAGVARLRDGRVAFVQGGVTGDEATIEITKSKRRFVHAQLASVLSPSQFRREPVCQHALSGDCGGCDWAHIVHSAQLGYKVDIVEQQLRRLGGIDSPKVTALEHVESRHLPGRTTVRASVRSGRAGFLRRRTNKSFELHECGASHPWVEWILTNATFGNADKVTIRVGSATGELVVITDGDPSSVEIRDTDSTVLEGVSVRVFSVDDVGYYSEVIAGRRWRISTRSFFQTSAVGAETLVEAVRGVYNRASPQTLGRVGDLYGGTGLLAAAAPDNVVVSVEANPYSSADARKNLCADVDVVNADVTTWQPVSLDCVIADPAREGLKRGGVETIIRSGASRVILVSCDPASLGRDSALLVEAGFGHVDSQLVDMFADTSRIEVVTHFEKF